jgi:hypothetical protein
MGRCPRIAAVNDELSVERLDHVEVHVVGSRRTVVTALPLKQAARQKLAHLLDARVLDVRELCDEPDLVLTPACSPQLIGALKRKYNGARVVIVELDDWDLDIEIPGPVKRVLREGADAYVLADSLEELAQKINVGSHDPAATDRATPAALTTGATVDELIAAFLRESIEYSTRAHTDTSAPQPRRP